MFNKQKIIIAIVALLLIVGLSTVGYFLFSSKDNERADIVETSGENGGMPGVGLPSSREEPRGEMPGGQVPRELSDEEIDKAAAQNLATFFIEMLGSYSPDARFQNVIDLKPVMTARMKSWADSLIANNLASLDSQGERVVSKVFSAEMLSYTQAAAEIELNTRREKTINSETKVYNQKARVGLVNSGLGWLVDRVEW